MPEKQNHCQQVQALDKLTQGFFSSKFDNILRLNKEVAELTSQEFYRQILKPRLDELMETGERMELGLIKRKEVMERRPCGGISLEEYYQKIKNNKI